MNSSDSIILLHVLLYMAFLLATFILVAERRPSLWLTLVFGLIIGIVLEMSNDLYLSESIAVYPKPHVFTLPGSQIPLSIVLAWGSFAVIARSLTDRVFRIVVQSKNLLVKVAMFIILLLAVSFAVGFAVELIATLLGGWIYPSHEGSLDFPLWTSGPTVWLVAIPLANATAGFLAFVMSRAHDLLHG